ncbi:MAG TPA: GNAT family N-acetyltransferase [Candidatus Limnocylindria bacterium]
MTRPVRAPRGSDAAALAELSRQLGYEVGDDEAGERLQAVTANGDAALLVATDDGDRPIGWVHVELKRSLLAPLSAQVMGLVVDERFRNDGIGRDLLVAAEAWAVERGCVAMLVGSRVTRERAHRFYQREGYEIQKTSYFFHKPLA